MNKADQLLTLAAIRQVELQRLASRFLMEALSDLRGLEEAILLAIDRHDPTGAVRAVTQNRRTADLLLEIGEATRRIMRELESRLTDDFEEAVEAQIEDEQKSLLLVYGVAATLAATVSQIRRKPLLIAGATLREWMRNITRDIYFRVSSAIRDGVVAGEDATGLKRRVKGEEKVIRRDGPLAPAERGLETVIRTAVDKLPGHVLPDVLPGSKFGKHGWQQISVLDNRTTEICRSYAWRKWDADFNPVGHKLPYNGGPPRHPNCLPGDSLVLPVGRISAASKRWYDGDMVVIRTASGNELRATPNHPILTDLGWMPAGLINESSKMIRYIGGQPALVAKRKDKHVESAIQKIADTLLIAPEFRAVEVPLTSEDFHGDAVNGEVAIIGADCRFTKQTNASIQHQPVEPIFKMRTALTSALVKERTFNKFSAPALASAYGRVSGFCNAKAFRLGSALHSEKHGFGAIAGRDALLSQGARDDLAADAKLASDILNGKTGAIEFDQVVRVQRDSFHGFVFNVETETGYYLANGFATHNCRSRIIMIFLDDPEPAHVTFRQLIERLSLSKQAEIFGAKNIAAWRRGVINDSELLRQANRPITLEKLRELTEKRDLP